VTTLFTLANQIPVRSSGAPHGSSKLYFYRAGTTTHQNVYTTAALSVAHDQPVQADTDGVFPPIFLNPDASFDYRYQLKTSADVLIEDIDNYPRSTFPTQAQIGAVLYPVTSADDGLSVANKQYVYHDGRRYGQLSSSNALELQDNTDCGLGLYRTGTANTTDECYIAYFAKDANGVPQKVMSISTIWGDTSGTNGYNVTRFNSTYLAAGVQLDYLGIRIFGNRGVTLLGLNDTDSPHLVGDTTTEVLSRGPLAVYLNTNSTRNSLTGRNESTGTSAVNRLRMGTNVSENHLTLDTFGGNHATKPSAAELVNQVNARLSFGTNGVTNLHLVPIGAGAGLHLGASTGTTNMEAGDIRMNNVLWIGDGVTAPTTTAGFAAIYVDTADGDLKCKFGDGTVKTIVVDT
jgi:hypothetical protein